MLSVSRPAFRFPLPASRRSSCLPSSSIHHPPSTLRRPSAAFTLIELLAVILIMALLLVIGMASLPRMQQALALDVAAGQLVAAFELARQTALTRHTDAAVCMRVLGPPIPYFVVIKNQYPISDYMLAGNSWQTNTALLHNGTPVKDILYTIHPTFGAGLPRFLPASVAILASEKPPASLCVLPIQYATPLNANLTVWPWSKTVLSDEALTAAPAIGGSTFACEMAGFNSRGEASITCTVGLYAVTYSQIALPSLTNMPNWVRVILTQGSGKIQVVRP